MTQQKTVEKLPASIFLGGNEEVSSLYRPKKTEVLRYHSIGEGVDEETDQLVEECMQEILEISRFKYVYRSSEIAFREPSISFTDSVMTLPGTSIREHLRACEYVVFMAVTLGVEAESRIRYYSRTDLSRSVVLDACATALVEALCEEVQERIRRLAKEQDFFITPRFSPGYGDLPLTIQSPLLTHLNAYRRIGLSVSESSILLPRKSVTALIGITKEKQPTRKRLCAICHLNGNCRFSQEGEAGCAG